MNAASLRLFCTSWKELPAGASVDTQTNDTEAEAACNDLQGYDE